MSNQNQVERWQAIFQPTFLLTDVFSNHARTFWSSQAKVLNKMQTFTEGWFERRHDGTKAALNACESMSNAKTPIDWFRAYQLWSTDAIQRLMADGLAFQQEIKRISEEMSPSLVPDVLKEQHDDVAETRTRRTVHASKK